MNKDQTRAAAQIMLAWAEGKAIEYRVCGSIAMWRDITNSVGWSWDDFEYRIKPEAREYWMHDSSVAGGHVVIYSAMPTTGGPWIRVREVIE